MQNLEKLTESFKLKWEKFLLSCDAIEETNDWDTELNGEMDVYFELELTGAVIRLIAADGKVTDKEAEYLNRCFGFEYTAETLAEVWRESSDTLGESLDKHFEGSLARLRTTSEKLADSYLELLHMICDIISESDGVIAPAERASVEKLRALH